jgi:GNAT superfamily N-acetyltransferase
MSIEIRPVDPEDERAIRDFYDIYVTCGRDFAGFIAWPLEELAAVIRKPTEDFAYTGFLAYDGDEVVGEGWYAAFLRANLDQARATPRVLPRYRRRGIGSALLERMEQHARANGRTTVKTTALWAMEYGPEGTGAPSVAFARKHGYPLVLVEAGRRLALPVATELLDELSAKADPASVEAVRAHERLLAESGQFRYSAVAISPDGDLAGYSAIVVRSADGLAGQWGTLVRRAHRGHGLGYGVKAAVIRLPQQERPDITAAITSNALTNQAMVAVNNRLGYEVIEYLGDVQKRL